MALCRHISLWRSHAAEPLSAHPGLFIDRDLRNPRNPAWLHPLLVSTEIHLPILCWKRWLHPLPRLRWTAPRLLKERDTWRTQGGWRTPPKFAKHIFAKMGLPCRPII